MATSQRFKFIDIAANLTDDMFKGVYNGKQYHAADLHAVLSRAWSAGIERIIVTGGSLQESKEALAIAKTDRRLFCTVGVHPTRCMEFEAAKDPEEHFNELLELARQGSSLGKVVAIGECGLDYDRLQFCPADIQRKYFDKQFQLAELTGLPMFLHMRAACKDFCEILQANENRFIAGVAHSFTGSGEDRDNLLKIKNLYIGLNGCSLKMKENLEAMGAIPADRLMIETDSPYCEIKSTHAGSKLVTTRWPSKKKERHDDESTVKSRNEPCHIRQVFEVVAAFRGEDLDSFSRALYENTCRQYDSQGLFVAINPKFARFTFGKTTQ